MNARNASPWIGAAAAAIFLALSPAAPAAAPKLTDCDCKHLREMRDRWCSARAARDEYERIKAFLEAETAKTGETRMYSLADKRMINQTCVKGAIDRVSDQGVVKVTGVTIENDPTQSIRGMDDCRIEVTNEYDDNKCLKQIVEGHETHHSRECQVRTKRWQHFDPNVRVKIQASMYGASSTLAMTATGDTKFSLTSAEFASEEAASYTREIVMINARWKELQKTCTNPMDFLGELKNADTVGQSLWNSITPDASGKRFYKMFDPSRDPCPYRPPKSPSACTLR